MVYFDIVFSSTLLQKFLNALKSLKIISNSQSIKIKDSEKKCKSIVQFTIKICLLTWLSIFMPIKT